LAALKIFTTALSISTVKTFSPANKRMLRRSIAHSKQVGINIGKVNHRKLWVETSSFSKAEDGFIFGTIETVPDPPATMET